MRHKIRKMRRLNKDSTRTPAARRRALDRREARNRLPNWPCEAHAAARRSREVAV